MSEFHEQFTQDPDFPEWYEWEIPAPLLRESRVRYIITPWGCGIDEDDGTSDLIEVSAYCENDIGFGKYHENAWKFIIAHPAGIERELRRKLWPMCLQNYREFVANLEPDDEQWQRFEHAQEWEQPSALDSQIELTGIGLVDDGFDEIGFSLFDFAVGWDEEHGLSILMHKDRVLAASCGADFTNRGPNLIPHARCIQDHDFTDGDLRIEG